MLKEINFIISQRTVHNFYPFFKSFKLPITEGPKPKNLQSAGTNTKKKMQGPMPKFDESAGTNDICKPKKNLSFL